MLKLSGRLIIYLFFLSMGFSSGIIFYIKFLEEPCEKITITGKIKGDNNNISPNIETTKKKRIRIFNRNN